MRNKKLWGLSVAGLVCITVGAYLFYQHSHSTTQVFSLCSRQPPVKIRGRQPAFITNYKLAWPNQTILKVYFDKNSRRFGDTILRVAKIWSRYCSITFIKTEDLSTSDIRITISGGGLSSAVGKECIQPEYKNRSTTFLEGLDKVTDSVEFKRIVLHEFGHILGVEHELKHPESGIKWNKDSLYAYYKQKYGWYPPTVDKAIFAPLDPDAKAYAAFDKTSIMVYAIGPPYASETIPWSTKLSETDKKCIAMWYPKPIRK